MPANVAHMLICNKAVKALQEERKESWGGGAGSFLLRKSNRRLYQFDLQEERADFNNEIVA